MLTKAFGGKLKATSQKKILDNVFCVKCLGSVTILLKTAKTDGKDLILKGKCKNCGKDLCRMVEEEE